VNDFVSLRLDTGQFKPDECQYVRFENPRFLYSHVLIFISKLKDQLVSPDGFRETALEGIRTYYTKLADLFHEAANSSDVPSVTRKALEKRRVENIPYEYGFESEMIEIIYHIYRSYQEYLSRNDMLDFGDLIFRAYDLLDKNERVKKRYQERFRYILVDEFQDTNEAQFDLLHLLARDDKLSNVTVVGDDKQAIYGWRNARVENVDDFKADIWGGQSLNVSKNYRSYGEILEVAHFSIIQDKKFLSRADSIKLESERLGSAGEPVVKLYAAISREQEATFIAQQITHLLNEGKEPDDIVILMRSVRRASKVYEDALRKADVPYRTIGGTGFYDRREIKDILAYLRVIDNPFDVIALARVLKRPPIYLNDLSLFHLCNWEGGSHLFDALSHADDILSDGEAIRRIKRFLNLAEEMWETMGEGSIFYLADQLVERSGYLKYVNGLSGDERERSLANIKKLLRMASEFERKRVFDNMRDFIQYVQFSMDQLVIEGEAGIESRRKAVQIMTVHQAKGLEFDTVFVVNAKEQSFPLDPRPPMFIFHKEDGLIINDDRDGNKFFKFKPYDLKRNSHLYEKHGIINHYEQFGKEHLSEERRIWYVAITRAEHLLYLSCPKFMTETMRRGNRVDFFREIHDEFADKSSICQIRSYKDEPADSESELPLWKDRDEPAFGSMEEAEEYGKRLMELAASWKSS
jgi:superfamily I DNA/RNA helicase